MTLRLLPNLETFAQAAERGSFTAAAESLGLTQAAISQRIAVLEKEAGVPLFHRKGGRVTLTDAGQRLYTFALRIFELHREARESLTGTREPMSGTLSLAASSVPGEHLLPGLLSDFGKTYPHIQVSATVSDSREVLHQVEQGDAQLGLVGAREDNPHLEFKSFACDSLVLIVPVTHPWHKKRQVPLSHLKDQPLILRERGSGSRSCLEQALLQSGHSLNDLRVALELGSNEAIKEAVLRGLGATILSSHVVEKEVESRKLHTLTISDLPLRRDFFVVYDRRRVLPPPAQLFLALIDAAPKPKAS